MKVEFTAILSVLAFGIAGCRSLSQKPLQPLPTTVEESSPTRTASAAHTASGTTIRVAASKEAFDRDKHGELLTDAGPPETILAKLSITVDGRDASPPPGDYARFTDPHVGAGFAPPRIEEDSQGLFYVYLSGGDGGGAHERRFVLSRSAWIRTEFQDYVTGAYRPFRPSD